MSRKPTASSQIRSKLADALNTANKDASAQESFPPAMTTTVVTTSSSLSAHHIVEGTLALAAVAGAIPVPI